MTIRIWHSYSCNNSSSFRMIARFANADTASEVADDLEEFFRTHAAQVDAHLADDDAPSQAQLELAKQYGFEWTHLLSWGSGGLTGDEPDVFLEHEVMIVQHTYCGGFGDLISYLEKRGATVDHRDGRAIDLTVMFRGPQDPVLDGELAELFAQLDPTDPNDTFVDELKTPWQTDHECNGSVAWFRDAGTVGLYVPVDPRDIENVKRWLTERMIEKPVIRIGDAADFHAFWAIANARCTACTSRLEYLDPLHDIETPQLVCKPCGGLYELTAFVKS